MEMKQTEIQRDRMEDEMEPTNIKTIDCNGKIIRHHKSAWAAWDYNYTRNDMRRQRSSDCEAYPYVNGREIKMCTTLDVVQGKLSMDQLIQPHPHTMLEDGRIATKCIDGHLEYTDASSPVHGWYQALCTR